MTEILEIVEPVRFFRHCTLCGYSHGPVDVYEDWIARFGMSKTFATGKKAGRPTQRTAQTERWQKIVDAHKPADAG